MTHQTLEPSPSASALPNRLTVKIEGTETGVPWSSLAELCHDRVMRWPDDIAVTFIDDAVEFTAAELWAAGGSVARHLSQHGVGLGDRVATILDNGPEHLLTWIACMRLGAVFVPLNNRLAVGDLAGVLTDADPRLVVTDPVFRESVKAALDAASIAITPLVAGPEDRVRLWQHHPAPAADDYASTAADDVAAIVFTGGTTGRSKGVMRTHFSFACGATRYLAMFNPVRGVDRQLANGVLFHGGCQECGFLGPLLAGIPSVWRRRFSASRFLSDARETGSTLTSMSGAHLVFLMRQPNHVDDDRSGLRAALAAVHGLTADQREAFETRFGIRLVDIYAMTETGMMLVHSTVEERRPGAVGRARGWCDVRIADERGVAVEAGQTGEILLRPTLPAMFTPGYVGRPDATLALLRDCWLHTGDQGFVRDGWLFLVGRRVDRIRIRGENVSAQEIEQVINSHPDVLEVGVVGVASQTGDDDIKAVVVVRQSSSLTPADVVAHCAERLAVFKVPRYVLLTSEHLPRTGAKDEIDRVRLRTLGDADVWDGGERGRSLTADSAGAAVHR
jgi:carnitine-CoA ligase